MTHIYGDQFRVGDLLEEDERFEDIEVFGVDRLSAKKNGINLSPVPCTIKVGAWIDPNTGLTSMVKLVRM